MAEIPTQVETGKRLSQHLALLHAGSTVTIDLRTPAGQRGKFRTTFVGYLPKQYVLVQLPESSKLGKFSQHFVQGATVTIRGLIEGHEGAVVAFASTIRQTLQLPSRLMVLEFPHSVTLQNLRSSVRIDTKIAAKVRVDNAYSQTTVTNLSAGGGHLTIFSGNKLMLTENKTIEIVIENDDGITNTRLKAVICNVKQQDDGLSFGVKFNDDSTSLVANLLLQVMAPDS
jgi:c-di-GMP-binding flagellar brake protein YcgR